MYAYILYRQPNIRLSILHQVFQCYVCLKNTFDQNSSEFVRCGINGTRIGFTFRTPSSQVLLVQPGTKYRQGSRVLGFSLPETLVFG